ncbi:hypothetical protein [Streptomyces sp. NPDC006863]|uniref:hypothetical protein n=1 Tax=Streptomyces sp. NPDC006863 TaxID=3154779 RepID=UPI0033FCC831
MPAEARSRPLIAVVGSVDTARTFTPPLRDAASAPEAARLLGAELYRAGCDIAVFSSKPTYVEADVVRGYAEAGTAGAPGTVFAYPPRHRSVDFALPPESCVTVRTVRDTSGEWELSYYRTLLSADGVLLMGGGQSTRIAGIIAMAQQVPVLPVAAFGGGAGQVWVNLDKIRNGVEDSAIALMGDDWQPDAAPWLIASLLEQREHKRATENAARSTRRQAAWRANAGLVISVLCIAASVAAIVFAPPSGPADARSLSSLLLAPLVAAVGGALIRHSFETDSGSLRASVRGLGAGLVSVLLYCASQLLTVPALLDDLDVRRLLFFTVPLGFSAGFTFDLVFERLRSGAGPAAPAAVDPLAGSAATSATGGGNPPPTDPVPARQTT